MPKRRSPAHRPPKVPARFRAIGGVDPRKLPPGSPYPCGDALVGQRVRGKRIAGVVQSCAVPPAGSRGPHYALGNVVSGSEVGRAWKASAREAEAIDARYSGPDFDLRRKRASRARPAPSAPASRPAVTRREELPLPLPQGGLRRREVSPDGLEIVRGFDELSRRWGALPSSANTRSWLAGLMVIDGDLHVYSDALVAMGVASALGNLYPPDTIRTVFKSAFNDAARAADLAQMGQDDRTPVVVDVKPVAAPERVQSVTRSVRLSFTSHGKNGEHFDVRAAHGARLTRVEEFAAPLPKGRLRRPELPLPLPKGGLSRPAPRAPGGHSLDVVRSAIDSFFATGPIAPDALRVLDAAVDALYTRAETSYMPRDPSSAVPADIVDVRAGAIVKRRSVRAGAATRTARAARSPEQKKSAKDLMVQIEDVAHRLQLLAAVLPLGTFPSDAGVGTKSVPTKRGKAPPAPPRAVVKRREELPLPMPDGGLRTLPRRSTVARREELPLPRPVFMRRTPEMPLPVPPSFLKDPAPTVASRPVGEAMEEVAEASADGTNWSKYQAAIFKFVTLGTGNAVVEAVAGSGKSTTIVEAVKRIPSNQNVLVLAFNVTIRDELKEKFKGFPNVTVRTLNGHAFLAMADAWAPIVLPTDKSDSASRYQDEARFRQILNAAKVPFPVRFWSSLGKSEQAAMERRGYDQWKYSTEVERWNRDYDKLKNLIELCRGFMALTPAAITDVQREYNLLLTMPRRRGERATDAPKPWTWFDPRTNTAYDTNSVIEWVQTALKASLVRPADGRVARFDAVFPTAMLNNIAPQKFNWIFVDETQDMDTAQLTVVQKSIAPGGRVVVVGDSKQAIYGFRGADVRAMARMEQALNAVRLPLSVSYRVPKCVETMVKRVLPAFEVPPGTPEGVCKTVTARHMIREWRDGDFVISRTNAPLEPLAIMAIQQGRDVIAVGLGDIQKVLRGVVKGAMDLNPSSGDEFRDAVEKYGARQLVRIEEDERRKRARSFRGKSEESIREFIDDLPVVRTLNLAINAVSALSKRAKGSAEIDQIISSVNYNTGRDTSVPTGLLKGKLAFTSVHKIKGAESPRVWVLNDTFAFQGDVDASGKPKIKHGEEMSDNARQEEINLWYVAVTRAKNTRGGAPGELYLVTGIKDVLGEAYGDDDDDEGKAKDA